MSSTIRRPLNWAVLATVSIILGINVASTASAQQILIIGGSQFTTGQVLATTELYDPASNSFAPPASTPLMHDARAATRAIQLTTGPNSGKVLVAGGGGNGGAIASTELYNPMSNAFELGPA